MEEMKLEPVSSVKNNLRDDNVTQATRPLSEGTSVKRTEEQQPVASGDFSKKADELKRGYSLKDVELKFDVDYDTDEVTVFVLDKSSRSVLRTIPPDEIRKLDAGEILELTA